MRRLVPALAMVLALVLVLAAALAYGESQGWRFLGAPAQRWLSDRLDRPVQLVDRQGQGFRLQLWGPIRLSVQHLSLANPAWSTLGPLLQADGLQLSMRWRDLLAWRPGRAIHLQQLTARRLDLQVQRLADGRASWQLGAADSPPPTAPTPAPAQPLSSLLSVQQLALAGGRFTLDDAVQALLLRGSFTQADGLPALPRTPDAQGTGLQADAAGTYRGKPVKAWLRAGSPAGWLAGAQTPAAPVGVSLGLQAGRAELGFTGHVWRGLPIPEVSGQYRLSGPSLAAVGEPLRITLPQTRRFAMSGRLVQSGSRWSTVVDQATVGASRLAGAFVFDRPPGQVPRLTGRLTGPALLLQDLAPAVGGATDGLAKTVRASGRVLPDRPFSLPALRAMNAAVLVALDKLDFGTPSLRDAAPLRGLIHLQDGVLAIEQLQATLAQGQLAGHVRLDGRRTPALWDVDLSVRNLLIEQWLLATQRPGQPPYASGRLDGRITLTGRGGSTAELLASANGRLRAQWRNGRISHLLVEAAGLDIAQGLGVLIRGDRPLVVDCGAADLLVKNGQATPQPMVVDTADSLLWLDGSLSLATEQLHLQAHARPKDWSPLSLRTPLHIDGTLGRPVLSLDKPRLLQRALPAAALALLVNPLVGLLPLMDLGSAGGVGGGGGGAEAGALADGCRALVQRLRTASPH